MISHRTPGLIKFTMNGLGQGLGPSNGGLGPGYGPGPKEWSPGPKENLSFARQNHALGQKTASIASLPRAQRIGPWTKEGLNRFSTLGSKNGALRQKNASIASLPWAERMEPWAKECPNRYLPWATRLRPWTKECLTRFFILGHKNGAMPQKNEALCLRNGALGEKNALIASWPWAKRMGHWPQRMPQSLLYPGPKEWGPGLKESLNCFSALGQDSGALAQKHASIASLPRATKMRPCAQRMRPWANLRSGNLGQRMPQPLLPKQELEKPRERRPFDNRNKNLKSR